MAVSSGVPRGGTRDRRWSLAQIALRRATKDWGAEGQRSPRAVVVVVHRSRIRVPARRAALGEGALALAEVRMAPVAAHERPAVLERLAVAALERTPQRLLRERHRLRRLALHGVGDRGGGRPEFGGRGDELVDDPFGGLVPVDDDEEEAPPSLDPAVAALTLTQRQAIPRLAKSRDEIAKLPIDHRGGFLLGFIDGNQTLEEILDICAMPTTDALGLIEGLQAMGVIEFD